MVLHWLLSEVLLVLLHLCVLLGAQLPCALSAGPCSLRFVLLHTGGPRGPLDALILRARAIPLSLTLYLSHFPMELSQISGDSRCWVSSRNALLWGWWWVLCGGSVS